VRPTRSSTTMTFFIYFFFDFSKINTRNQTYRNYTSVVGTAAGLKRHIVRRQRPNRCAPWR
jgi:hypothetical protein